MRRISGSRLAGARVAPARVPGHREPTPNDRLLFLGDELIQKPKPRQGRAGRLSLRLGCA